MVWKSMSTTWKKVNDKMTGQDLVSLCSYLARSIPKFEDGTARAGGTADTTAAHFLLL